MAGIVTPLSPGMQYDLHDAYVLINATVAGMTGVDQTLKAVDTASFVAVGQMAVKTSVESLFKSMSTIVSRTIFSSRPYQAKLDVMRVIEARWGEAIRKVVYLSLDAEASTCDNTDLNPNQLANGNSVDMYRINNPGVVQLSFYSTIALQDHITRFEDQINVALSNEFEYLRFWDAFMIEMLNSIESQNEARRRLVCLNAIAASYQMGNVIDLAAGFNAKYGTQYTRAQLLSDHFKDFMMYTAAEIKKVSKSFTDRTELYQAHIQPLENAGKHILHHTPMTMQRLIMYTPIMIDQETIVMPELFGPDYLRIMKYEEVNYWQNPRDPSRVQVTPSIMDVSTGLHAKGDPQNIPYVVAYLYDEEHLGVIERYQKTHVTPVNAAACYWNIFFHWRFGSYVDYTEKHVLFVIGDGGAGQVDVRYVATSPNADDGFVIDTANTNPIYVQPTSAARMTVTSPVDTPFNISGVGDGTPIAVTSTDASPVRVRNTTGGAPVTVVGNPSGGALNVNISSTSTLSDDSEGDDGTATMGYDNPPEATKKSTKKL